VATLVYSLDANNTSSYSGTGSSWYDVSGNSYIVSPTCSLVNSPTFGIDGSFKYLKFTNAGVQYGQFAMDSFAAGNTPGTLAYQIYHQSFSMALWAYFDTTPYGGSSGSNCQTLAAMRYSSTLNSQFAFACGANGNRLGQNEWVVDWFNYPTHYYSSTNSVLGGPGYPLLAGQWYHVVGVFEKTGSNAGIVRMYVNAALVASLTFSGASAAVFDGNSAGVNYLNRSFAPDDATYCGNTRLNLYQIYQGVLSSSEITTLYNGGTRVIPAPVNQRGVPPELGLPVTTRQFSWNEMARRSWGSEFSAPDRRVYEFSNGRGFDSTDRGDTGFYEPPST